MEIFYALEPKLSVDEFIDVLHRSTLAERRPVDDTTRVAEMLRNADVIVTARDSEGTLLGVSRAISDFSYCTYLADLAVDQVVQKAGIGRKLLQETHRHAGWTTTLILLSAPQAETYYPHIGLQKHNSCWQLPGHN